MARIIAFMNGVGLVAAVPSIGPFASRALVDLLSWRWLHAALALPMPACADRSLVFAVLQSL